MPRYIPSLFLFELILNEERIIILIALQLWAGVAKHKHYRRVSQKSCFLGPFYFSIFDVFFLLFFLLNNQRPHQAPSLHMDFATGCY